MAAIGVSRVEVQGDLCRANNDGAQAELSQPLAAGECAILAAYVAKVATSGNTLPVPDTPASKKQRRSTRSKAK